MLRVQSDRYCYARSPSLLCGRYMTGSACDGDSGGMVGFIRNGRWEQAGIVSYVTNSRCDPG